MANLLEQAIECNYGDRAAKIIQHALGIESDDVANYVFPKTWPIELKRAFWRESTGRLPTQCEGFCGSTVRR